METTGVDDTGSMGDCLGFLLVTTSNSKLFGVVDVDNGGTVNQFLNTDTDVELDTVTNFELINTFEPQVC